jgi:hypothetical protein
VTDDEAPPLDRGRILAALERYDVRYVLVGGSPFRPTALCA